MRDPKRIDKMLDILRRVWHKHPDLRMGQLVVYLANTCAFSDVFNIEDDLWEKLMVFELQRDSWFTSE